MLMSADNNAKCKVMGEIMIVFLLTMTETNKSLYFVSEYS